MAELSLKQYKKYRTTPISPWIKKRYLLSGITAISYCLLGFHYLIYVIGTTDSLNPNRDIILLSLIYSVVLLIIFSIGSIIAWLMPGKLKSFFDRRLTPIKDIDLTEEEIEKIFLEK